MSAVWLWCVGVSLCLSSLEFVDIWILDGIFHQIWEIFSCYFFLLSPLFLKHLFSYSGGLEDFSVSEAFLIFHFFFFCSSNLNWSSLIFFPFISNMNFSSELFILVFILLNYRISMSSSRFSIWWIIAFLNEPLSFFALILYLWFPLVLYQFFGRMFSAWICVMHKCFFNMCLNVCVFSVFVRLRMSISFASAVRCHLVMGIYFEKCIIRQFCHGVNIIECTYINLDGITYYCNCMCYTWRFCLQQHHHEHVSNVLHYDITRQSEFFSSVVVLQDQCHICGPSLYAVCYWTAVMWCLTVIRWD